MKNLIYLSLLVFVCSGCAHFKSFADRLDYSNGINQYEAMVLAKNEVKKADFRNYFGAIEPKFREDKATAQYPGYWFVEFTPTVTMDFWSYFVVINKRTGEIVHAQDYYWPTRAADVNWIFYEETSPRDEYVLNAKF